jgi:predicted nucleotidyltransferase component of viral defense system
LNRYISNQVTLEELISITSERLGLNEPYVVEKDLYVTLAIETLINIDNRHFKLVFQGGTALAKAHRIVQRMSEDCDFRIIRREGQHFSNEQQRRFLRHFRKQLIEELENSGFLIHENDISVRNEGQFITFIATYPTIFPVAQVLKPHLALEFFLGELHTPSITKPVTTLIRQTIGDKIAHPEFQVEVMSLEETAAEKWVALTRRVATMTRQNRHQDPNLVRHLYDLYKMQEQGKLKQPFLHLITEIIQQDREQFKSHNTQYYKNPAAEIDRALVELESDQKWERYWNDFIQTMVFDQQKPSYGIALKSFKKLSPR